MCRSRRQEARGRHLRSTGPLAWTYLNNITRNVLSDRWLRGLAQASVHPHPPGGPRPIFAWVGASCYSNRLAKPKKFDLENLTPVGDDEDEKTLAAAVCTETLLVWVDEVIE